MRVMVMIKANKDSESGVMPSEKMLTEMTAFNEELVKAGIMLAGEGLHPSNTAKRVRFTRDTKTVIDGPYTETKELLAGFWIWKVASMDEAVAWVKRIPAPAKGDPGYEDVSEIEIRPIFEAEDFGAEYTPELRAKEQRMRDQLEQQKK
jgi:hypothetical protein